MRVNAEAIAAMLGMIDDGTNGFGVIYNNEVYNWWGWIYIYYTSLHNLFL